MTTDLNKFLSDKPIKGRIHKYEDQIDKFYRELVFHIVFFFLITRHMYKQFKELTELFNLLISY